MSPELKTSDVSKSPWIRSVGAQDVDFACTRCHLSLVDVHNLFGHGTTLNLILFDYCYIVCLDCVRHCYLCYSTSYLFHFGCELTLLLGTKGFGYFSWWLLINRYCWLFVLSFGYIFPNTKSIEEQKHQESRRVHVSLVTTFGRVAHGMIRSITW